MCGRSLIILSMVQQPIAAENEDWQGVASMVAKEKSEKCGTAGEENYCDAR